MFLIAAGMFGTAQGDFSGCRLLCILDVFSRASFYLTFRGNIYNYSPQCIGKTLFVLFHLLYSRRGNGNRVNFLFKLTWQFFYHGND